MKSKLTKRILAVVITAVALSVLLALSSLAAVTGGYGSIDGLEDGKNYEAAEVTLNSTGDGTAIGTPFALDATTNKDLAGLYVVRETGTTDWSDVIYVYGKVADRKAIFDLGSNNLVKLNGTEFVPGYFYTGYYSKNNASGWNTHSTFGTYGVSTQGDHINGDRFKAFYNVHTSSTASANEKKSAWDTAAGILEAAYLQYNFAQNEVIPVSDLKTYKYSVGIQRGGIKYTGQQSEFEIVVLSPAGTLETYTYLHTAADLGSTVTKTVDFTGDTTNGDWLTALPTEGYILAFRYKIYANLDDYSKAVISSSSTGTRYTVNVNKGYEFNSPMVDLTAGVSVDGTVIKGLDSTKTYAVVPYTILGADIAQRKTFSGVEEYDLKNAYANAGGLYGVSVSGNGYYADSDAILVYVMNKFSDMSNLGEYVSATDKTPVRASTKEAVLEWKPGTYLAASAWASSAFRANDMYSVCLAKDLNNALSTADPDDEKTLRENALATMKTISTRYAYAPNEIIPISQVKTMKFMAGQQNIVLTVKDAKPKVELYVMHEDSSVTVHTWIGDGHSYLNNSVDMGQLTPQTVDVQAIEGLPTEGWLVGFKYYPIWEVELENINPLMSTSNGAFSLYMRVPTLCHPSYYEIEQTKLDAPTGITVEGTVFKGLDENVTYAIAPYTIVGADADNMHKVTGVTEFDLTSKISNPAGLYALVIPGDDYYKESDPTLVYIAGSSEMRKDIGIDMQFECEGALRDGYETYYTATNKTYDRAWIPGLYSGYRNYYSAGGGYHFFVCDWYGRGSVKSAADLKAALATEDPSDELEIREGYKAFLQKQVLRYTYLSEEIIPVDEIFTMTFSPFKQHGAVTAAVKPKLILYVMDENGEVTEHSVVGSKYTPGSSAAGQKFDVQAIEGLPSEGWVVGFEFMPAAEVELEDITSTSESTAAGLEIAIIWGQNNYEIKEEAPTPPLSSFPVIPGGYGEISGLDASALYEYQLYDEETDTWSDWASIPAGATAFRVTEAGTYKVRAKETELSLASIPAEIIVLTYDPEYPGFDSQIVTMHLPNDFIELTAEYEMDVTVKNWVSTLALENIKTVSPKSTITIFGDDYKFVVVAEKVNLEGNKTHYIDMTVSFEGESRFDTDYEAMKALAGEKYVTEVYFESSSALPFEEAEFWVFVGDDQSGNDVQLRSYNKRINKLRNVETATVIDGWATFTNYAMTYVIIER